MSIAVLSLDMVPVLIEHIYARDATEATVIM